MDKDPLTDNPAPPQGLYWYLWMGRLLFRDANWNPHFPSSAAKLADLYHLGTGIRVDGVITGTKGLALDLVELYEDIEVPGVDDVLTRQLTEEYTEGDRPYECLPHHVSNRDKRCFDEELFFNIRDRLTTRTDASGRRGLAHLFKDQLDRKDILIHLFPPMDDSFLWEQKWNGAIPIVDHDYLMVVDSSLPGHTTKVVQRSWEYTVALDPERPVEAQLQLRYHNNQEPKDRICRQGETANCYFNYFRVYVPQLSRNIQMPPVPLHESALKLIWGYPDTDSTTVVTQADTGPSRLTELGGFITVEPGVVTTVPVRYQLPARFLRQTAPGVYEYRLLIQKTVRHERGQSHH